ncbi:tRNA uridine-5-carboxymethylaminomethyl(34) synthesis GTPase MnmE [Loktanella sp. D2R18]|uniref:tRNA uridine-5-carboxymethylaminomethyl(34) synthesis GTPase MnmE n=1 Tax=Rhodobacterales TaxID=204455 RepID=UPI000DE98FCF|nr:MULTISPECIES: tRNA uridine-5-carboxymethylaminomethyl(34) synthesis GTPase MnmE [Rhodobacterales]MDO6590459.1 tRNA uridine-5-carboxymethylaminomethyl(34) synthesis GTPase MnmE [Yoonia sp. 1_MG-2023]RBW41299.1 tRNA uridine-5-carboxymethylaminomethyl(34) synthesis GTPase MnmE [Loktanella sp. D2R18]
MDTIFALATAKGRAGVAVVRLSGPHAVRSAGKLMGDVPVSRGVRVLRDQAGQLLDEAFVLRFAEGRSFTGEEVVELHLHGSPAVLSAVLRELGNDPKLRPAEAGEFTHRAMDNGQLDLAQVEGLADLIDAETESQRRQAVRVFSGALGMLADGWRIKLIRAAALLEATIDFADEEVPVDVSPEVRELIGVVKKEMRREAEGVRIAERLRDGFEVAIIGAPNVGKSTLLNRLAGRDVAITSEIAGTTRDVIEVRLDLDGIAVTLLDTAGLRDTDDIVEGLGVQRARERAGRADIRVHMLLPNDLKPQYIGGDDILVHAKSDLGHEDGLAVSGQTGAGIDDLVDQISAILKERVASVGIAMRERHRVAMLRAIDFLEVAEKDLSSELGMTDLIAEELRSAIRAVDSLVGRVDVEQVLDEIFSSFCIGK